MIALYDTLTRKTHLLQASDGHTFRFYACGPTVYGPAHIGNFRAFLLQDVLRRALEANNIKVLHVRNITDVDDKTIRQSQKEGLSLTDFTQKWTSYFHEDCKKLNLLVPHVEPRAAAHIPEQIQMIEALILKKHAYIAKDGSVYFKVSSFSNYGKLSGLDSKDLKTQAHNSCGNANLADEYSRESVQDFALWKAYKTEDGPNGWDSPWGKGRPGWHIECSAMALRYLGTGFDLHGGGIDLCFPHHENEIAQSECACQKPLARHWFHNAHLLVNGQKMSKSLGNLYTLSDIEKLNFSPIALRYSIISGHYHQPLNFTLESLHAAQSALDKIRKKLIALGTLAGLRQEDAQSLLNKPDLNAPWDALEAFHTQILNDLNTPGALGELFKVIHAKETSSPISLFKAFSKALFILGLSCNILEKKNNELQIPQNILELAQKRMQAKKDKNFPLSDEYRSLLQAEGWMVQDTVDGFTLKPLE